MTTPAARPLTFRAPGRVNLIGEHTDYNDGFVLPVAVPRYTWVSVAAGPEGALRMFSETMDERRERPLGASTGEGTQARAHWTDYVLGVARVLEEAGYRMRGADLHIRGDVPIGAGLSSSASLEVASALALLAHAEQPAPDRLEIARLCQRAENDFVGARCGIMDQFASLFGRAGHAMLLDCRSLEHRAVPLPSDCALIACNSMVRHDLATGTYNQRRAECEEAVRTLGEGRPEIRALRDVAPADLEQARPALRDAVYRRCRHVISENRRVLAAAYALEREDAPELGRLMLASHGSLRDDYEVSCPELDLLVELAMAVDGVHGTRMTGGGFGGCTITLVRRDGAGALAAALIDGYGRATGRKPEIHVLEACDGAGAAP